MIPQQRADFQAAGLDLGDGSLIAGHWSGAFCISPASRSDLESDIAFCLSVVLMTNLTWQRGACPYQGALGGAVHVFDRSHRRDDRIGGRCDKIPIGA